MRPFRAVGLAAVLAVAVAACGGSNTVSEPTSSTASVTTLAPTTVPPARQTVDVSVAPWTLPSPVSREVVLTDGTSLLVLGGQDASHASTPAALRIDPATGTPTTFGSLDPAVHDAAGVLLGQAAIVIAGGSPPPRATVQAIDAAGTRALGALPGPRTDHVAALVNGAMLSLGGADNEATPVSDVFASADGATWRAAGNLVEAVRYPALAVVNGAVYLFGGVGAGSADTTSIQRYDPATGTTQVVGHLPTALSHASAVELGGVVFIVGGFVDNQPSTQVLRFDPQTAAVTPGGTLPAPLTDAGVAVIGGVGYFVGGEGPGRATTASVEVLRPR